VTIVRTKKIIHIGRPTQLLQNHFLFYHYYYWGNNTDGEVVAAPSAAGSVALSFFYFSKDKVHFTLAAAFVNRGRAICSAASEKQ
jgi:hypothetical protein